MSQGNGSDGPPILAWARRGAQPGDPAEPGAASASPAAAAAPHGREVTADAALAAALPHQGTLERDSALRLLYLAAAGAATGLLELDAGPVRYALFFRRGMIEHAVSDAAEDALGRWLVARGAITPDELALAEAAPEARAGDLVMALARTAGFRPADQFRLLQEHGGAVVAKAISVPAGGYRWSPGVAPPPSAFPLAPLWGAVCEAVRRLDAATVRALLGDRVDRLAARTRGRVELAQLKLTPQEARAAALFDGRSAPAALASARPPDAEMLLRVALLLAETELLRFGERAEPGTAAPPQRPAPPPPPQASSAPVSPVAAAIPVLTPAARAPPSRPPPPPASPAPPADDLASLRAVEARLRSADHFEALGVGRNASASHIKTSYLLAAKRFHPDAGTQGDPPEVQKLRVDLFARISEAWRVLGDDQARADYLRQLETPNPGEVDVSGILRAEEIFRKATVLVKNRRYPEALHSLEEAIKINPDEPEFEVWLAWTRFLVAPARERQQAASAAAIEAALRKMPRCAPGYLFLAQMARALGDTAAAERHLRRGLAIAPDHVELARELKTVRK